MKRGLVVLITASLVAILNAQTPKFDVASLTPLPDGARFVPSSGGPGTSDPARYVEPAASLLFLVAEAYGVNGDQISGPGWMASQYFSIHANVRAGTNRDEFNLMLQELLAERLHVAIHREAKPIDGYDLVIAKGGPKLQEPGLPDPAKPNSMGDMRFTPDGFVMTFPRAPMQFFADRIATKLSQDSGTPNAYPMVRVTDKTGITGLHSFTIHYVPAVMSGNVPGPDLFAALESQLGLKLEPVKMSVDIVVVDHAEKIPVEN